MDMAQLKPTYRFGAPDVTAHQRKGTSLTVWPAWAAPNKR